MSKTLLVPGLNGSGEGHWQRFWAADHDDTVLLEQDRWEYPVLRDWLSRLEDALLASPGANLVGHSLGSVLIAHLAGRPAARLVKGALLVAPCDVGLTGVLHPGLLRFGEMPQVPLPFPTLVVGSRNDPYMPADALRRYALAWQADVVDLGEAGHINIASGFGRWPAGYELLRLLGARDRRRQAVAGNVMQPAAGSAEHPVP
ncbi:alpha/beta hydrolase [Rhizobium sp. LjRoot30]|uniref:RBBP9/YdeN family alpha/beta hydrolase n=1 Tax=Rhizobium sp. LjRoot30 TaxID=3342320 RepID=UPI003ECD4F92